MTHTVVKCFTGLVLLAATSLAQQDSPSSPAVEPVKPPDTNAPIDKRVFGVLPNYRTADGNAPYQPISPKRKLWIGFKDSFDYPVYFTSAIFAGINQLENTSPRFGQGCPSWWLFQSR